MSWDVAPLKRVATVRPSNVDKKSKEGEQPVRLCNYTDVYYQDSITDDLDLMRATATSDQIRDFRLHEGDVVITKDSEDPADIGVPAHVGAVSNDVVCGYHLTVIRPASEALDGRFLYWQLAGVEAQSAFSARASGITRFGLRSSDVADLCIRLPDLAEQRAIADFLDTETARIDALIALKQQLRETLQEHEQAVLLDALGDWRDVPSLSLRQLDTWVLTGPFGTQLAASEYVEAGVPVINPTHIVAGRLEPEARVTVSEHVATRLARHKLRPGDIVLGRKGDVGRSALVGPSQAGWLCGSDSIAIRPAPKRLMPEFLTKVLQSDFYRQQLASRSTGATMLNVNESTLRAFRIPAMDVMEQQEVVDEIDRALSQHARIRHRLDMQVGLLHEHRQALVTAAVTGELEVPGVAA